MRLGDRMVAMALAAFGPVMFIERVLVFAAVKQTGVGRMAKTAAPAYLRDAGWAGSVVAMAGVACGRAEITAHEQCASMHAVAIFGELRCREWRAIRARKSGHSLRIGMAGAACLRARVARTLSTADLSPDECRERHGSSRMMAHDRRVFRATSGRAGYP